MFNQAIKLAADKGKLEAMLSQAQQYNKALEEDVRTMTEKTQELEESLVSSARRAHTASSSSSSARRAHTRPAAAAAAARAARTHGQQQQQQQRAPRAHTASSSSARMRGARCVRGLVHAPTPPCLMPLRPP
jgi:peptidoglycan hydrolase CwlO-like protein